MTDGPWLLVQLLDRPDGGRVSRYPGALRQALMTCGVTVDDLHAAVEDRDMLVARCPGLDGGSLVVDRVGDLLAHMLHVDRAAVRMGLYPTLAAAHRVAGDS